MSQEFWDDNNQVDNQENYVDEVIYDESRVPEVMDEVLKRIEQAKLYESLIRHDFFAAGSARPEIQQAVTDEIRSFILKRLEILVGIKSPEQDKIIVQQVNNIFTDDQVSALRDIADRLIQKSQPQNTVTQPQVKQFVAQTQEVRPAQVHSSTPKVNQTKAPQPKPRQKVQQPSKQPVNEMTPEQRLDPNSGVYKPQAVSKVNPPKAMPSQIVMNAMNAQEVMKRQQNGAGGINDQILKLAIGASQSLNKNIVEDMNENF